MIVKVMKGNKVEKVTILFQKVGTKCWLLKEAQPHTRMVNGRKAPFKCLTEGLEFLPLPPE
jgi:hypothetical protein